MSGQLINTEAGQNGLRLTNLRDFCQFAEMVIKSGMAPRGMDTPSSIVIALQAGAEVGLTPMQSIQNIANINGRPCLWGDAQLALVRSSPLFDESAFSETIEGEGDKREAVCTIRRKPDGQVKTARFSVAEAKRAGLWQKKGPWQQYPDRMLQMRARAFALRDTFTDLLKGIGQAEEVRDFEIIDSQPRQSPVEKQRPAIEAEPPKPKKTLYGEHGERLREMLYEEGADSREAADAMIQIWSGGLHQSAKRVMEDENESQALLEVIQQQRQFEQSEEQPGEGQLFDNEPETKNPLAEGV